LYNRESRILEILFTGEKDEMYSKSLSEFCFRVICCSGRFCFCTGHENSRFCNWTGTWYLCHPFEKDLEPDKLFGSQAAEELEAQLNYLLQLRGMG